jgi:hypothetical protein
MDMGMTTWHNPTDKPVRLEVFVSPGQFSQYHVPAQGKADIPSQFTSGIQQVRDGVIVGGLGPQLVRDGEGSKSHTPPDLKPSKK